MLRRDTLEALVGLAFVLLALAVYLTIPSQVPAVSLSEYGASQGLSPRLFPRLATYTFGVVGFLHLVVIHALAYTISWSAFPLAMSPIAAYLGRDEWLAVVRPVIRSNIE